MRTTTQAIGAAVLSLVGIAGTMGWAVATLSEEPTLGPAGDGAPGDSTDHSTTDESVEGPGDPTPGSGSSTGTYQEVIRTS